MAATPQDFSIWSRLTGNPYPRTPEERMFLAPHVRNFVENIGRQGGYPVQQESGIKRALKAVGKTALAAGLLVGGAMAAHHYLKDDDGPPPPPPSGGGVGVSHHNIADNLENIHSTAVDVLGEKPLAHPFEEQGSSMRRSGTIMTKLPLLQPAQGPEAAESDIQVGTPFETPVQRAEGQDELIGYTPAAHVEAFRRSPQYARMKEENPSLRDIESPSEPASMPQAVRASMDVTPPTTAQRFGQGNINPEIQVRQIAKGAAPGSGARESLRTKPVTESEKLVTSQSFAPVVTRGPSHAEIRELDTVLLRSHGHMNREQREAVRNQLLSEKYEAQPETEYVGTGKTIQPGAQPEPKEFLRQGVERMKNITHQQKYGYDPEQGFGATQGPAMEEMGTSHSSLLAEQLQREAGRQAGQADIYKKLQAQRVPYAPHPADMMAIHGQGFFHPSAYGRM